MSGYMKSDYYDVREIIRASQDWISQLAANGQWHPYRYRGCCFHGEENLPEIIEACEMRDRERIMQDELRAEMRLRREQQKAVPDELRETLRAENLTWRQQQKAVQDELRETLRAENLAWRQRQKTGQG